MDFLFKLPPGLAAFVVFACLATAQYPPPVSYQHVLSSPIDPSITISYKQPDAGTCSTAYSEQKQYTGYIELPPYTLSPIQQNYSINTFFWFVEARLNPESAPLTIWLNGGPGSSSMFGFFNEIGPCKVIQTSDGSYGTQYSMWGWDRSSNVLFIDQPNQVGFSYDQATNASYDIYAGEVYEPPTPPSSGLPKYMYLNGTFGTASADDATPWANTANTTQIAAQATWHFLQSWLSTFPKYNPTIRSNTTYAGSNNPIGVNLFTESYGGKFGPAFASFFEQQNQLRKSGALKSNNTLLIQLESVGILDGLVDDLIQDAQYPKFAYNNTYGIQAISQTDEINALGTFSGTGMCSDQIINCRAAMASTDPNGYGDVPATNLICKNAEYACNNVTAAYISAGYDPYDIRQKYPSPDPPAAYQEYLNNGSVLSSIGAKVNYTESNKYVQQGFIATGDTIRGGQIEDLAYLLSKGIRVALIYGDADFVCNWYGGEAISFAVAAQLPSYPSQIAGQSNPPTYASGFSNAGYAEIVVNSSYVGGAVRQYGNLSFSRIYDAGHFVPFYQPETAFTVFTRVIQGTDIATGNIIDLSTYNSTGAANSTHTNKIPSSTPSSICWVRSWNTSCTDDDTTAMLAGKGVVANGIFFQDAASVSFPTSSVVVGTPDRPSTGNMHSDGTSSAALTGVYTATSTPSPGTGSSLRLARPREPMSGMGWSVFVLALSFALGALVVL
ncbi:carboxypeptidase s1 like a [Acrodontium crateriforme]|uniref:Carboxypeptidase s1 like a n=1 Tax=Acrodontium crateriforme TaxID=150365 RepID=A0AAQ3R4U9_9PEZI|nr:carboxypeptidase s1 like a [Acrodontium crateriforme]